MLMLLLDDSNIDENATNARNAALRRSILRPNHLDVAMYKYQPYRCILYNKDTKRDKGFNHYCCSVP